MKNIIRLITCAMTALFLSFGEARADELIKTITNEQTGSGSIIRNYDGGLDVVCHHSTSDPFFMMYKNSSPVAYGLILDHMARIYDFEIYNDTVYFCGISKKSKAGLAVIGYFDVNTLLNSSPENVSYVALPSMEAVTAIEVGWFANRKHVVGVGVELGAEGAMVDMIDETTYWKVNLANVGGDTVSLSDLAITDSLVVVTSKRNPTSLMPYGRLWLFDKPVASGASLFPCNVTFYDHDDYVGGKYFVKALRFNRYVTARANDFFVITSNDFVLSYYTGHTYDKSVAVEEFTSFSCTVGGLDYEVTASTVAMLLKGVYYTQGIPHLKSVIYEIPDVATAPAIVPSHVYEGVLFESLDYVWTFDIDRQHFVSTGFDVASGYGTPYYMKFKYNFFDGSCLEKNIAPAHKKNIAHRNYKKYIYNVLDNQIPEVLVEYKKMMSIETQCNNHEQHEQDTENED